MGAWRLMRRRSFLWGAIALVLAGCSTNKNLQVLGLGALFPVAVSGVLSNSISQWTTRSKPIPPTCGNACKTQNCLQR